MHEERPQASAPEVVRFDSAVYDLATIKRAAYRFTDRFTPDIVVDGSQITCSLTFSHAASADRARIIDDFRKEVLDQDLRRAIADETAPIRNTILALAFASSDLQGK